jgi:hypothetical protein
LAAAISSASSLARPGMSLAFMVFHSPATRPGISSAVIAVTTGSRSAPR